MAKLKFERGALHAHALAHLEQHSPYLSEWARQHSKAECQWMQDDQNGLQTRIAEREALIARSSDEIKTLEHALEQRQLKRVENEGREPVLELP